MANVRLGKPASTMRRRELVHAGLAGAATLLAGRAIKSEAFASQKPGTDDRRTPDPPVIDVHCHARGAGYKGPRKIEHLDAAGVQRARLLGREITGPDT